MRTIRSYLVLCVWVLALLLPYCSPAPQPPAEERQGPLTDAEINRLWVEQKTVHISIPADIDGKAELTRNFYFIMDGSGSMREQTTRACGGDQQFPDKITGARWAIKKFLQTVPAEVNIGLYIYDNNGMRQVVPLGVSNRDAFLRAIDQIDAGGGTPLAQALRFGTDRLVEQYKKQLGYGEFRLVAVTDGLAESIPEAALYAARFGIPIYTIGLCVEQNHPLRNLSVSYLAADNYDDLARGLTDTLAELPIFDVSQFDKDAQK